MLVIRLTRKGKKNQPFFRVVVTDKKNPPKGGRAVEDLGYVDPLTKRKSLNKERILYWISKGAQPSASVHNLLVSEKIIDGKKVHVSKISKKKQSEIIKAKTAESSASAEQSGGPATISPEASLGGEEKPVEVKPEIKLEEKKEPAQSPPGNEAGEEPKPETKPEEKKEPAKSQPSVDNQTDKEPKA